jgi:IPT/TIG domain
MSTGWLKQNGLNTGETFWWFTYWYGYEFDDGFDCRFAQDEVTINQPITVTPRISSLSPARGLIGSSVHVIIQGRGFQFNPTVNAGNGISVTVNFGNSSNFQIDATFAIAANASTGNHAVSVAINGMTSNSMNFYVQIPSKLIPADYPGAPNGVGPLQTPVNGDVRDLRGTLIATGTCGVYRNYAYYLVDQEQQPQRILEAFTINETFTDYHGPFQQPSAPAGNIAAGSVVPDIQVLVFSYPRCLQAGEIESFTQGFYVTIGQRNFPLSTTNFVARGYNIANQLVVDVSNTIP